MYLDKSERLCASMHVYDRLQNDSDYQKDDEVFGRVYEISENFGVFVAVDDKYSALIPKKEVFEKYRINQPVYARVSQVLEDGRLSLSVKKKIPEQMEEDAQMMLEAKGFKNAVVSLSDECCDVIVGKDDVTDEKRAQIEDIIKRKTNIGASNIVISTMD